VDYVHLLCHEIFSAVRGIQMILSFNKNLKIQDTNGIMRNSTSADIQHNGQKNEQLTTKHYTEN
jgi:hypothetical protein